MTLVRREQKKGRFIVFEGIDGCGKSTQVRRLAEWMRQQDIPCETTMEPTEGTFGRLLRQVLTGEVQADPRVLAPLFVTDRLDHLLNARDGLAEKVASGTTVICDRYYYSNYAYQSVDLPMDWVISANAPCRDILKPDLCIFLDIDPELALARIRKNRDHLELFEKKSRLVRTRENYMEAFHRLGGTENIRILDGSGTVEETAASVLAVVQELE